MFTMHKLDKTFRSILIVGALLALGTVAALGWYYLLPLLSHSNSRDVIIELTPDLFREAKDGISPIEQSGVEVKKKSDRETINLVFVNNTGASIWFQKLDQFKWQGMYVCLSVYEPQKGWVMITLLGDHVAMPLPMGLRELRPGECDTCLFYIREPAGEYQLTVAYNGRMFPPPNTPIVFEKKFWITIK